MKIWKYLNWATFGLSTLIVLMGLAMLFSIGSELAYLFGTLSLLFAFGIWCISLFSMLLNRG